MGGGDRQRQLDRRVSQSAAGAPQRDAARILKSLYAARKRHSKHPGREREAFRVSGQVINQYQSRVYMNAREVGLKQADAAYVAEISERSGQRIESGSHRPSRGRVRDWRTCAYPLAGVWEDELEPMLKREPRLKPMTLYEYLQEKYPGKYGKVLRTVQRRVRAWKALHGPAPEVMFELRHEPGLMGFSDFTELKGMEDLLEAKYDL